VATGATRPRTQRSPGFDSGFWWLREHGVQVEVLDSFLLLSGLQGPQQLSDLVFAEPRECQVDGRVGLQVGEVVIVPRAGDLVEGEVEQARLLNRWTEVRDRDTGKTQASGRKHTLAAADDRGVFPAG